MIYWDMTRHGRFVDMDYFILFYSHILFVLLSVRYDMDFMCLCMYVRNGRIG